MDPTSLPIAVALALIKAKRRHGALIPACSKCSELQEELNRLRSELDFLKKKKTTDITSLVAAVHLSEDQIQQTDVWQFFSKGDQLQRTLASKSYPALGQQSDGEKNLDLVVSLCADHISKMTSIHWQPDALFDSCIHFLVCASQPDVFSSQKNLLYSKTKTLIDGMLQEILLFSYDNGRNARHRDQASKAVVELSKCNGMETRVVEVILNTILEFIKGVNPARKVPSYQTLENLFFYCWILERVIRIAADNARPKHGPNWLSHSLVPLLALFTLPPRQILIITLEKAWPAVLSTLELLALNTRQASNLPPLLERYIYKIVLNIPKPPARDTNHGSQADKLQQSQLCHLLGKIEQQIMTNSIK